MKAVLKQAPTLLVIGVTGFVAYTVMFQDGDLSPPKAEAKPGAPSKAATKLVQETPRNPFLMDLPAAVAPESSATAENRPTKSAEGAASKDTPVELAAMPAEEDTVLESMKLGGTFVDSREQHAIIDNKLYTRGDQLRGADGATLPYIVTEIQKDRALVRRGRRDFVIAFSDVPRAAGPRPVASPKSIENKPVAKADALAKFTPIAKGKPGQKPGGGNPDDADPTNQREMLLQLLSALGGSQGGGNGLAGANPLSALGSSSGSNSPLNSLVNPTTIGAGLDAIMGKYDNVGQGAGTGP